MCFIVGTQWAWRFLICERLVVFANFLRHVLLFVCLSLCWIYYNWFSYFSSSFLSLTLFQLRGHFLNLLQPFRWLFAPRYSIVKCSRPFSRWSFSTGFCFSCTYFSVSALIYVFLQNLMLCKIITKNNWGCINQGVGIDHLIQYNLKFKKKKFVLKHYNLTEVLVEIQFKNFFVNSLTVICWSNVPSPLCTLLCVPNKQGYLCNQSTTI